jgi:hypothetical protein
MLRLLPRRLRRSSPTCDAPAAAEASVPDAFSPTPATDASAAWIAQATEVCAAASRGDLEARVLNADDAGEQLAPLLHGINHLLDMTDAFVREATASLEYAGRGKFFRRVLPGGMLGSYLRAGQGINAATVRMHETHKQRMALEADFTAARSVSGQLDKATHDIKQLSAVIARIAGQTNILAMNAAIEAARVGEAGKGFAVVADEVKQLADHTAQATRQIQSDLEALHAATRSTLDGIERIWTVIKSQAA